MSLGGMLSSTISTVFSNIIIVVDDGNVSRRNDLSQHFDSTKFETDNTDNFTLSQSPVISLREEAKSVYVGQGVAHGISQEKIITVMCMLVIFSIFGCLGNGLVLYVFTKKSDKVTSTIFILALAWTDFFTCLIIMPFTVTNIALDSRLHLDFLCKAYEFLITSNVPLSAFIMVAIAVDRYFSICHPFMRVVTPKRARISIVCLVMTAFTLGSITACIYGVWAPPPPTHDSFNTTAANTTLHHSYPIHDDKADKNPPPNYQNMPTSETHSPSLLDKNVEIINKSSAPEVNLNRTAEESHDHPAQNNHSEGLCAPNELIFSDNFTALYQKIYISFYIISLLAVFTLYFFIYRSVAERREWRRKQKSFSHSPMTATTNVAAVDSCRKPKDVYCRGNDNLELAPQNSSPEASNSDSKQNGNGNDSCEAAGSTKPSPNKAADASTAAKNSGHENGVESISADKKTNRERRDFNFLANIRTAIMLFVVTLVFIISFLPAWLMATYLIEFEIVIFYMHFIYNVANPVIYAFMNQSFRKELKRVFQRGTHLLRGG